MSGVLLFPTPRLAFSVVDNSDGDMPDIVPANLPPVKRIDEVPLLSHGTIANRGIIERVAQTFPSQ
ncbi:MAG: hypothetical protein RIG26_13470 [Thalassospira sp.]|uniref:hypothetical protein n=1 Tax=Thalassospira sp. TaxID=1912094 RepID=UPI0032EEB4DA